MFERRDAKSPIFVPPFTYAIPYMIYDSNVKQATHIAIQKYFSFTTSYIAEAINNINDTIFNFAYAFKLSAEDLFKILSGNILHRSVYMLLSFIIIDWSLMFCLL